MCFKDHDVERVRRNMRRWLKSEETVEDSPIRISRIFLRSPKTFRAFCVSSTPYGNSGGT